MAAKLGTVFVEIDIDGKKYKTALKQAEDQTKKSASKMQKSFMDVRRVGTQAAKAVGATFVLAAGVAVAASIRIGASFEKSMAQVRGVMRATEKEFQMLTNVAKEMGRTTEFTASQAAKALGFLGMAGFRAKQAIVALPGVLDLATAGVLDLGTAADIASNILSAFQLPVKELGRVNDVLVATATRANTSVLQMGEAFKFAAPTAKALGFSIEETAAFIGLLGNAGVQGSLAGTNLAFIMGKAAKSGKGLVETLKELVDSEAPEVMKLFGDRSSKAALILRKQLSTYENFVRILKNAKGEAKELADIMRDTLQGSFDELKSTLEGKAIDFMDRYGKEVRFVVDWLILLVRQLNFATEALGENDTAVVSITKVSNDFVDSLKNISKFFGMLLKGILGVKLAFKTLTFVVVEFVREVFGLLKFILMPLDSILNRLVQLGKIDSNPLEGIQKALEGTSAELTISMNETAEEIININKALIETGILIDGLNQKEFGVIRSRDTGAGGAGVDTSILGGGAPSIPGLGETDPKKIAEKEKERSKESDAWVKFNIETVQRTKMKVPKLFEPEASTIDLFKGKTDFKLDQGILSLLLGAGLNKGKLEFPEQQVTDIIKKGPEPEQKKKKDGGAGDFLSKFGGIFEKLGEIMGLSAGKVLGKETGEALKKGGAAGKFEGLLQGAQVLQGAFQGGVQGGGAGVVSGGISGAMSGVGLASGLGVESPLGLAAAGGAGLAIGAGVAAFGAKKAKDDRKKEQEKQEKEFAKNLSLQLQKVQAEGFFSPFGTDLDPKFAKKFATIIKDWMNRVKKLGQQITSTITGAIQAGLNASTTTQALEQFRDKFGAGFTSIVVGQMADMMDTLMKRMLAPAFQVINDIAMAIELRFVEATEATRDAIGDIYKDLFKFVGKMLDNLFKKISSIKLIGPALEQGILGALLFALPGLVGALTPLFAAIGKASEKMFEPMFETMFKVTQMFEKLFNLQADWIKQMTRAGITLTDDMTANMVESVKDMWSDMTGIVSNALEEGFKSYSVSGGWENFQRSLKEGIFDMVVKGTAEALSKGIIFLGAIGPFLKDLGNLFVKAIFGGKFDQAEFSRILTGIATELPQMLEDNKKVFEGIADSIGDFGEILFGTGTTGGLTAADVTPGAKPKGQEEEVPTGFLQNFRLLNKMISFFMDLGEILGSRETFFDLDTTPILDALINHMKTFIEKVLNFPFQLRTFFKKIKDIIGTKLGLPEDFKFGDEIRRIWEEIKTGVREALTKNRRDLRKEWKDFVDSLKGETPLEKIQEIWDVINLGIKTSIDKAKELWSDRWDNFLGGLTELGSEVGTKLQEIWEALKFGFRSSIDKIKELWSDRWNTFLTGLGDKDLGSGGFLGNLMKGIIEGLKGIVWKILAFWFPRFFDENGPKNVTDTGTGTSSRPSSQVNPNIRTVPDATQSGGGQTINMNVTFVGSANSPSEAKMAAERLGYYFEQQIRTITPA